MHPQPKDAAKDIKLSRWRTQLIPDDCASKARVPPQLGCTSFAMRPRDFGLYFLERLSEQGFWSTSFQIGLNPIRAAVDPDQPSIEPRLFDGARHREQLVDLPAQVSHVPRYNYLLIHGAPLHSSA